MIIVSTTNDEYAQHLGVMLTSVLENIKKRETIEIYIIDGNISANNKRKLNKVVDRFKTKIVFISPNSSLKKALPDAPTIDYISLETYFRIFLPVLLDQKIKKVIYLDCDLIVKKDLGDLWDVKMKKYALAAVDESIHYREKRRRRLRKELGLPINTRYFNAGVLLLNLKRWRESNLTNRLVEYLQHRPRLKYMDQDALNAVLQNDWLPLDYKWNYTKGHWRNLPHVKPVVIHFSGRKKPWNSNIRFKNEYFKFVRVEQG